MYYSKFNKKRMKKLILIVLFPFIYTNILVAQTTKELDYFSQIVDENGNISADENEDVVDTKITDAFTAVDLQQDDKLRIRKRLKTTIIRVKAINKQIGVYHEIIQRNKGKRGGKHKTIQAERKIAKLVSERKALVKSEKSELEHELTPQQIERLKMHIQKNSH
jgi:hypothetical protein